MGKPVRLVLTILLFGCLGLSISVAVAWGNAALFEHQREPYSNIVPIEAAEWSGVAAIAANVAPRSNPRAWSREFSAQGGFVPGPIPTWSWLNDPPPEDTVNSFEIAAGWPFVCLRWLIDVRTQEKWLLTDFPQGAIEGYLPSSVFFSSGRDVVWLPVTPIPTNLFMDIGFWGGILFGGWFLLRVLKRWKWIRCRHRRKCASCGYSLADANREICTECGRNVHDMPAVLIMPRWSRLTVILTVIVVMEAIFIVSFLLGGQDRALLRAAHDGDVDEVVTLLAKGVDPNVTTPENRGVRAKHSETALMVACTMGRLEVTRRLIEAGGDVDAMDGFVGHTPLHRAAENGHVDIINVLCEAGAVVDAPDKRSDMPLYYAIRKNMRDAALTLIERGADVNSRNRSGYAAMHRAAENGNIDLVKLLEQYGASIEVKDLSDQTPIFYAVFGGQIETAEYLLSQGADISVTTLEGQTLWVRFYEILKSGVLTRALVHGNADINQKTNSGMTPLMFAVGRGTPDTVRLLLDHGADPTIKSPDGKTALDIGNSPVIKKMLEEAIEKWEAEHEQADEERTP